MAVTLADLRKAFGKDPVVDPNAEAIARNFPAKEEKSKEDLGMVLGSPEFFKSRQKKGNECVLSGIDWEKAGEMIRQAKEKLGDQYYVAWDTEAVFDNYGFFNSQLIIQGSKSCDGKTAFNPDGTVKPEYAYTPDGDLRTNMVRTRDGIRLKSDDHQAKGRATRLMPPDAKIRIFDPSEIDLPSATDPSFYDTHLCKEVIEPEPTKKLSPYEILEKLKSRATQKKE